MKKNSEKNKNNPARLHTKDFNTFRHLYQTFALYCLVYPFIRLFYKIKITGKQNVPRGGKLIFAPNHISYFDPFLAAFASRLPISYMAKKELFNSKSAARQLNLVGSFAVNRTRLEVSTIKTVKDLFTTNWSLGIFPQGGIRKNKKIENVTKGITVIAKMANANIIPISITGCDNFNWKIFGGTINVKIGIPISYELDADEIIDNWSAQVASMCGFEYVKPKVELSLAQ